MAKQPTEEMTHYDEPEEYDEKDDNGYKDAAGKETTTSYVYLYNKMTDKVNKTLDEIPDSKSLKSLKSLKDGVNIMVKQTPMSRKNSQTEEDSLLVYYTIL